ncbi:MAG: YkgJ family cysteine cluster protein [Bacteroidales bacterium]|nr:YkgJ family cysteine cluster protein [Bacteroidales bacterium]
MNFIYQEIKEACYERTICSCEKCRSFCKKMPGYLIPDDIYRIYKELNKQRDSNISIGDLLSASPGAIVQTQGSIFRTPTIVPSRSVNNFCIFLDNDEKCSIHSIAPYGCAYFDDHMSKEEADERSRLGLSLIMKNSLYKMIWNFLWEEGLRSKGPEELRNE